MNPNVAIQPASLDLVESFYDCIKSVVAERKYLARLEPPTLEAVREFTEASIAGSIDRFFAIDDDQVIGSCDIIPNNRDGFRPSASLGIMIHRDYRSSGIGTKLMETAITAAWMRPLSRIELEVFASNVGAIELCKRFGFIEEGRKLNARYIDGAFDDNVLMALHRNND